MVAAVFGFIDSLPQDLQYHDFADKRAHVLSIPNSFDVLSNIPFLAFGGIGLVGIFLRTRQGKYAVSFVEEFERFAWAIFFAGIALVCFGSAYYHWSPNNQTLVWDRLPMTISFMALFAIMICERWNSSLARLLLLPLLLNGFLSVWYWNAFDDLRWYLIVQFLPLVMLPLLLGLCRGRYTHGYLFNVCLALYILAKIVEVRDKQIFEASARLVSGHTLKHLFASFVPLVAFHMLRTRTPIRPSLPQKQL
eukprot:GILJ01007173.1.p1 GENE.GILJ01007173.1~~GILJ01007173.1.p1  ORF type:complete len:279 (-),score=14.92 GILJ01007173.1:223-972(-)